MKVNDDVLQSILYLPLQLKQARSEALNLPFDKSYKKVNKILVCGMGGSRFPALVVYHLFKEKLKLPIFINDEYRFPSWVDDKTLVILSSYSGSTEEVLFNFKKAIEKTSFITAITTGGKLAEIMREKNFVFYKFNPVYNPSAQPRMGMGYAVGSLIGLLENLDVLEKTENFKKAIEFFESQISSLVKGDDNTAYFLSEKLYGKFPFYIVAEFLEGLGKALANQTNETSKSISAYYVIPELNHHLMEGLKHPEDFRKMALFVFFNSNLYHPRVQKRFEITKEVVEKNEVETLKVYLKGEDMLSQAFYFMGLASFFTYLLSKKYKEEPDKIPFVDYFKKRLKDEL